MQHPACFQQFSNQAVAIQVVAATGSAINSA
jgi:hypothetical protein